MKRILTLIIFFIAWYYVDAQQNNFPILSTSIETTCINNCIDQDSVQYISDSSLISAVMTVQVFDLSNIASFRVKLGTSSGASDLLDKTFTYDVFGNVGDNCTYSRSDATILLGLGNFNGLTAYFSELIIERGDHSLTSPVIFNR